LSRSPTFLAVSDLSGFQFDKAQLAEALACLPLQGALFLTSLNREREGRAMTTFFWRYRKRGPVNALQMRLQG